ncbi:site-specific integrase [Enterococcus sp. 669A]|uniref:Site-specific integrase n=1 Tax=Candidatus Enterococcus moelleringii TaxID=2815325 RepID=A0ABS3LB79_9ENTE|nr:site-specific integrase [Enterococcus sp. 669A]MBO1306893.1 site-specific integrase [Enterococcus sp. 669A]
MARSGDNLSKRVDGRWEGRYIKGRKPNGRIIYGSIYHRKYHEAKRLLFEAKLAHRENYLDYGKHRTSSQPVNEWFLNWLEIKRTQVKPTTLESYESKALNHIYPFFMDHLLSDLTEELIQEWVEDLTDQLSINSVHAVFRVFKQGIKLAFDKNLIHQNPAKAVQLPKSVEGTVCSFSQSDQSLIEEFCLTPKELPIIIALDTGMRISEIMGLQWQDINWKNRTIHIQKIVQRIKVGKKTQLVLQTPKTKASRRMIPLTQRLYQLLQQQKETAESSFVFAGKSGQPIDPRTVRYRFEQVKKKSGIENLPFHALRHTFATRCLEAGINVTTLSELLGHSSVKMTLDIYTNSFLSEKRKAIQQLEIINESTQKNPHHRQKAVNSR